VSGPKYKHTIPGIFDLLFKAPETEGRITIKQKAGGFTGNRASGLNATGRVGNTSSVCEQVLESLARRKKTKNNLAMCVSGREEPKYGLD